MSIFLAVLVAMAAGADAMSLAISRSYVATADRSSRRRVAAYLAGLCAATLTAGWLAGQGFTATLPNLVRWIGIVALAMPAAAMLYETVWGGGDQTIRILPTSVSTGQRLSSTMGLSMFAMGTGAGVVQAQPVVLVALGAAGVAIAAYAGWRLGQGRISSKAPLVMGALFLTAALGPLVVSRATGH